MKKLNTILLILSISPVILQATWNKFSRPVPGIPKHHYPRSKYNNTNPYHNQNSHGPDRESKYGQDNESPSDYSLGY